jgi:VWFA-related protein
MTRLFRPVTALAATVASVCSTSLFAQNPTFRADAAAVAVNVSVKRGNNPVLGLGPTDFVLSDNGVRQQVSAVSLEAVPIDVTIFLDTSGSTAGLLAQMKKDVHAIVAMLGPRDRLRLLTIGHSVYELMPWTSPAAPIALDEAYPVSGISLVYDALYLAVLHAPEPGRRHLVVALTDGEDECSVVRPSRLRALAGRIDTVVHWVPMQQPGRSRHGAAICSGPPDADIRVMDTLVNDSGGRKHTGLLGASVSPVTAFERVLDDYRRGYLLYFVPEGVARAGWHVLKVEVPSGRYTVRARSGYVVAQ